MAHAQAIYFPGTHRLIAAQYAGGESVLETLPLPKDVLADLSELDAATNERKMAERGRLTEIGLRELVFGIPEAPIINAAFTHPGPHGGRFHSAGRGAWYAALELQTCVAEVGYHKRRFLQNVRSDSFHTRFNFDYVDFLADFRGKFHHLNQAERAACLRAEPVPACYQPSQTLAGKLLLGGALGVTYASVRRRGGTCVACFRPVLVSNVRQGGSYEVIVDVRSGKVSVQ